MHRRVSLKLVFSIGLGFMMACGGSVAGKNGGGDDSSNGGNGSDDDAWDEGGAVGFGDASTGSVTDADFPTFESGAPIPQNSCPIAVPTSGSACNANGSQCEYGADLFYDCDTLASCVDNTWTVQAPSTTAICSATYENPVDCPSSGDAVPAEDQCSTPQTCLYLGGAAPELCVCEKDQIENLQTWGCYAPQAQCPSFPNRPRIGTSCATEGLECDYGTCGNAANVACFEGVWLISQTPCN